MIHALCFNVAMFDHVKTIAAPCSNGSVRLTNNDGHNDYGVVLVCFNEKWTTICTNDDWSKNEASVVCKQLGHSPYGLSSVKH